MFRNLAKHIGPQMYVPEFLLNGIVPAYLQQRYQFWLDTRRGEGAELGATGGNHELVGYPKPDTSVEDQGGRPSLLRIAMRNADDGSPDPQRSVATIRRFWTETVRSTAAPGTGKKVPRLSNRSNADAVQTHHLHHEKLRATGKPMTLLNPLSNVEGSPLQQLAQLITRIEDLSNVLVWTNQDIDPAKAADAVVTIEEVELPRLNLSFTAKEIDGQRVLACRQLDGMFISCQVPEAVRDLISGIPECILLENKDQEYFLLISAVGSPQRPPQKLNEDTVETDIAFDRTDEDWLDTFSTPPYGPSLHFPWLLRRVVVASKLRV